MPDTPSQRAVQHPAKCISPASQRPSPDPHHSYAELAATSNYTFLRGASHPEELVTAAAHMGYRALAVTDAHSLAGIVRAHAAAKELGFPLIVGSRLTLRDYPATDLLLYATDAPSYSRLCTLLTLGLRRAPKGSCDLQLADLQGRTDGLLAVCMPGNAPASLLRPLLGTLLKMFDDDRLSMALQHRYTPRDADRLDELASTAQSLRIATVAVNAPLYHHPSRRPLQDVLTAIRLRCTVEQAGRHLEAHAERCLKPPAEMHRLFAGFPEALARTVQIAHRCRFTLDQLRYRYPAASTPPGRTPIAHLRSLATLGAAERYPAGVPPAVVSQINYELALIDELGYAPYFLTVHDLVTFARSRGILCQGRGAAANSAVCYCIGVTAVDPARIDVLFERFISRERNEPPDIDIDFEHERREEVIQYIYRTYGRDRAALTAEVITYRRRSAVRDVGKALGLSLDTVDRLAKDLDWWEEDGVSPQHLRAMGLNPSDPILMWLCALCTQIVGFPRHLGQHVGGFVITQGPLSELVPVENAAMPERTVIQWDKDDLDAVGILKIDVLGLGMLTAIRRTLELLTPSTSLPPTPRTLATIPPEDPATYAMIQRADTVGVFQIESRAQMSMLPRLRPREFYDLVIEVAIVRPGPIQGDMVHPYLRRRNGQEPVHYAHPAIEQVLRKTLGVPLFQEQCMALAVKAAGFTPGQADQLRRAMAAWKRKGNLIYRFGQQLIDGMTARGIPLEFAQRCFEQIKGFSEYGFPESHAASFALLVYASCWLKRHHPAAFCAALLNSQPMGFYAPAQLVRDARAHGVSVRPVDVLHSRWDCTLEPAKCTHPTHAQASDERARPDAPPHTWGEGGPAVRLGMRQVAGLSVQQAALVIAAADTLRTEGTYPTMMRLWRISGASASTMRKLATADAFNSLGLTRQQAVWETRLLRDEPLPLFEHQPPDSAAPTQHSDTPAALLPGVTAQQQVTLDYQATGLSLKAHPVLFLRPSLQSARVWPCADLQDPHRTPAGARVGVAGIVLVRQRPSTANDVTFITLEDETGIANLIIWPRVYQAYRRQARAAMLVAHGQVQREGEVVHLIVRRLTPLSDGQGTPTRPRNFH